MWDPSLSLLLLIAGINLVYNTSVCKYMQVKVVKTLNTYFTGPVRQADNLHTELFVSVKATTTAKVNHVNRYKFI